MLNISAYSIEKSKTIEQALLQHRKLRHSNFDSLYKFSYEGLIKRLPKLFRIKCICKMR